MDNQGLLAKAMGYLYPQGWSGGLLGMGNAAAEQAQIDQERGGLLNQGRYADAIMHRPMDNPAGFAMGTSNVGKPIFRGATAGRDALSGSWWTENPEYAALYAAGEGGNVAKAYLNRQGLVDTRTPEYAALYDNFLKERNFEPGYAPLLQQSGLPSYLDEWRFVDWLKSKGHKPTAIKLDEGNGRTSIKVLDHTAVGTQNEAKAAE